MDKLAKALLWVKTNSVFILGVVMALLTVAFFGKRSAARDIREIVTPSKTSGALIEEQAKEADALNTKIADLNEEKPIPTPEPDKSMEDLLSEYEKL